MKSHIFGSLNTRAPMSTLAEPGRRRICRWQSVGRLGEPLVRAVGEWRPSLRDWLSASTEFFVRPHRNRWLTACWTVATIMADRRSSSSSSGVYAVFASHHCTQALIKSLHYAYTVLSLRISLPPLWHVYNLPTLDILHVLAPIHTSRRFAFDDCRKHLRLSSDFVKKYFVS